MTEHGSPGLHRRDYEPDAVGPLKGVRVLDLSRLFAGNVLTQMLGDYGAEVIKVEPPAGDTLRDWKTRDVSTHWKIYSRNKKSLALNLRDPAAKGLLLKLVGSAAVFLESFRPGVLEAMGLAPADLLAINPRLVIVRISGWGQDGPYARRPGFGTIIEGMSGFAAINGFADREPVLPPAYLADGVAGLYGASAVLIALREAERDGGAGQVIDLPLYDPLLAILGPQAANYRLTGQVKLRTGSRSTNSAPRNAYRCRDGAYVSMSGSTQSMAKRIFETIGRPDLADDPRFRTNADRLRNVEALDKIIEDFIVGYDQADAVALFEAAEVTVGPIYDTSQILTDPHVIERDILADYQDDEVGLFPMHHVVPRLERTPGSIRAPAPRIGQHNRELLAELGVGEEDYAALLAAGTVAESAP
ncbi:MAG: CoA transferase [Caulobacteraceae bacterium]|nr:CoA transferase [Caulobacteraceae bacterium]